MIRRYGDTPVGGQRYTQRPGAYAILPRGDRILVTHQRATQPGLNDEIQLPGGGIDPGEGAIQALHREVFEETGYRIAHPRRLGVFRRFAYMPEYDLFAEKVCHIYVAFPVLRHGPPSEEGHTAVWMDPEVALGALYNDGDVAFLARLL